MPTYAYRCRDCGHQFDIFQRFSDDALTTCPTCEGTIRRVIQPTGVVFKGTGFYINDSKATPAKAADKAKAADGAEPAAATATDDGKAGGDTPADKLKGNGKADKAKSDTPATGNGGKSSSTAPERTPAAARSADR